MPGHAEVFLALGIAFLLGVLAHIVGKRTFLPRVTLLILAGVLLGLLDPAILRETPDAVFEAVTAFALSMVGFLLGGKLERGAFREHGGLVLRYSLLIAVGTAALVAVVLRLLGFPLPVALVLGAISAATAPAATTDVAQEAGASGAFADTLLGVVALDDVWGLLLFSLALATVGGGSGGGEGPFGSPLLNGLWEIGGALLIGVLIGLPMAQLTGRIRSGEPTLVEALGVVVLGAGVALFVHASVLLTAVTLGAVVVNFARHHDRPFHAIEGFEWPFLVLFFLLAGAELELSKALGAAGILAAFIVLRFAARVFAGWLAGIGRPDEGAVRRWLGVALLPQAGVAIGMAVIASQRLPEQGGLIVSVTLGSTVLFEIVGPIFTRLALRRTGSV